MREMELNEPEAYEKAKLYVKRNIRETAHNDVKMTSLIAMFLYYVDHSPHGDCCRTCEDIADDVIRISKEAKL